MATTGRTAHIGGGRAASNILSRGRPPLVHVFGPRCTSSPRASGESDRLSACPGSGVFEPVTYCDTVLIHSYGFGWMVVRFVRVIRAPACARVSRVSRVCPGSPRYLFTGTVSREWRRAT